MSQRPHSDLRVLADLDDSNSSSEQALDGTILLSPSVVALGIFLDGIGDPRRLLHDSAAASTALECELTPVPAATAQGPGVQPETATTTRDSIASSLQQRTYEDGDADAGGVLMHTTAPAKIARLAIQDAAATHAPTVPRCDGRGGGKRRADATLRAVDRNAEASEKREAMVNPSRDRLKEELAHLKGKATNLERELLRLRSKPATSAAAVAIGNQQDQPQSKTPSRLFPRRPIWERLANSAKDRKRSSEAENDRLREVVEKQAKLPKTLERMFMKAAAKPMTFDPLASSRASSVEVDPTSAVKEDDRVFQELVSQLDLQYQLLNLVQAETGLAQRTREGRQSDIRGSLNSGDGTLTIECCDVKHFPFAMDAVADAGWRCMTTELIKDVNYTATVVHKTDNFALTKSTVTAQTANEPDRILRAKTAMKRFAEQDRRVLLFNSVSKMHNRACNKQADNHQGTDSGLRFTDQGWATIESTSDDSRWPACILRICVRVRLQEQPVGEPRNPETLENSSVSELLAGTYAQVLRARHQIVENFVLEDLLAQRHQAHASTSIGADEVQT